MCSCSKSISSIARDICSLRNYFNSEDRWETLFKKIGVAFVSEESCDYGKLKSDNFKDLSLFSENGYFLLNERYVFPIRDMLGNIVALVGWFPDTKKYITTPSRFFSKDSLFFGMEQLNETGIGDKYFLVEGIFDSLSLRSLGFNAVAQMGIVSSYAKITLYGLFGRIVGIPDNDKMGKNVLKNDLWAIPQNGSYMRWVGDGVLEAEENSTKEDEKVKIKDIDKLCSLYEEESLRDLLNQCLNNKNRYIKVEL